MPAVIAVFITAAEALAEVVAVVALVYVVATISVVRVLISIRVLIAGLPAILPVRLSRAKALRVAVVDGLPKQVRPVLIRLVVVAATRVPIIRGRVEVLIAIVVVAARVLNTNLPQPRDVLLLIAVLRRAPLLPQVCSSLICETLLLRELLTILRLTLLLLLNSLLATV